VIIYPQKLEEMVLFFEVSALGVTIALVIVLVRMKVNLGIVMLSATFIMALFGKLLPVIVVKIMLDALSNPQTIELMLIIIGITALGHLLKVTGKLNEIITNLRDIVNDVRLLIALIPALVGLLPVPGGAVMSAPLIEQIGNEAGLDRDLLATANIIFRHINSYAFPMSTGIILMSSISGIGVSEFLRFNIPIIIIIMIFAFFYIFRKVKPVKIRREKAKPETILRLLISLLPFMIVITMGLVFHTYFPLALLMGILYVVILPEKDSTYVRLVKTRLLAILNGVKWDMVFAMAGVMVFKDVVAATGFLNEISELMVDKGVPLFIMAILFPFIAGIITGNNGAAIGLTAPLFLSMLPEGINAVPYYYLIFIGSSAGYITSPFHMCLVLTVEYYKASLPNVLRQVAFVCSWIIAASLMRFAMLI
jgi:integral membrane protein (TIGR00529 family)